MNNTPGLKKYYVGFSVLIILALGFLIYTLSQAGAAKTDRTTNKSVEKIGMKLDIYITDNGVIPDSLATAGVDNIASAVKYTKLSDSQYKICINYKTTASGFDASWTSLFSGALGASGSTTSNSGSSYFDTTVEFNHKKGENCQTIQPNLYNGNNSTNFRLN